MESYCDTSRVVADSRFCMIHSETCSDDLSVNLVTPRDVASWESLLEAATIRQCKAILDIAAVTAEGSVPAVFYHRQCRCKFTMKDSLQRVLSRTDSNTATGAGSEHGVANTPSRQPRVLPSSSRVLDAACIFCQKTKYLKRSTAHTREPLVQCRALQADDRIREYALRTQDARLLGLLGCCELVAAEARYHASCYLSCCHSQSQKTESMDNYSDCAEDPRSKALDFVTNHLEKLLFQDKVTVAYADIAKIYISKQLEYGQIEVSESAKRNLRPKLEKIFGERLCFCQSEYYYL